MRAAGGDVMEPHGESVLKAGGRGVRGRNSGGSLGQVVKAGSADSKVDKPSSADSAGEGWIYVRGHRLKKAGLHINCHGNVYVPDSEDEESSMEDQACGLHVSAGTKLAMDLTPQVHDEATVGAAGVEMAPDVTADQAAHKDLPVDEDSRMKVPTEVPEQLKEVLANMDPIYHDVFVSMYKILVPICFRSFHR